MQRLTTIERAFELADEGVCRTVADIRTQLKREQHDAVDAHMAGSEVQRQLKKRMSSASRPPTQKTSERI